MKFPLFFLMLSGAAQLSACAGSDPVSRDNAFEAPSVVPLQTPPGYVPLDRNADAALYRPLD